MRLPLFTKSKKPKPESDILLAMVLLSDNTSFQIDIFLEDLRRNKELIIGKPSGDQGALVIEIDRELVAIGSMPVPVPWGDIEGTAEYAYNWETALDDLRDHQGHLIISIMQGTNDAVKRFRVLTGVICAVLRASNAVGVYIGGQSLLIPKEDYLAEAENMSASSYPVNLWIYFGLRQANGKNSGYTYGLKAFGKKELEVIYSERSLSEIRGFLYNITHYLLASNAEFKDGQTCGLSETERVKISLSKGHFVDSETFKLEYK